MNTFQLSCFLAVAEYLNFGKAAQQLHVTHPAVSQQIRSLEKELNVELFRRTTRSVRLTEEGKTFLRDARQIVTISERARKRFDGAGTGNVETLDLGCYNFPSMFLLVDTLRRLRDERPGIHPRLQMIPFHHIYQMLEDGDLDAVVGFREPADFRISALYKEIIRVPMVCVCSPRHEFSGYEEVTMQQLKSQNLVLFAPTRAMHPTVRLQGQLIGDRSMSGMYFCESAEAITVLVMADYGVSVLPSFLAPDVPDLCRVPVKDADPASFGVYYKSLQGNQELKSFIRCAREAFA